MFLPPDVRLPNSPHLNPTDNRIWDVIQDRMYQTSVQDVADLKQRLIDARVKHCGRRYCTNGVRDFTLVQMKNFF